MSSEQSFRPFTKADLERAAAARKPKGLPVVNGVPMTTNINTGQQIPDGRVAARYNAAAQHSQESQGMQPEQYMRPPERPKSVNISPNQKPLSIPGQDQGAMFGRHPDGTPLTPAEYFQAQARQTEAPAIGASHQRTSPVAPYPQHQYQEPVEPPKAHAHIRYQALPPVSYNFVSEAEGVSVDLPSQFAFYPFKDLFVYPLKGYHLAKLARAHAERSQTIMLEVVSSVLRTSDPNFEGIALAPLLVLNDYYWLLYYLRQNNYTKSTFVHTTRCVNPVHIKKVEDKQLPEDSLTIQQVISKSSLKETKLETLPVIDAAVMGDIEVRPATMQDMVETAEHELFGKDHEFDYLSQLACYLVGETLEDRIRLAATLGPDQIAAIQEYEDVLADFGIEETIVVRCKECQEQRRTRVRIDASTFLPA